MPDFLSQLDVWIVIIYLAAMLIIGWCVTDGSRDVEGYTVGNRQMRGWVIGMSVLGTFLSSITFLAVPARVYKDGNWNAYVFGMALPVAAVVAVFCFIPLYRGKVHLSAYELLEQRFGYWARGYAAFSFLALQLLRVAMVLLLVALAVEPLLGWGVVNTLVAISLVVIVYDVMGGIKAVIWTDVAQVFVLTIGAAWCLWAMVSAHPGGVEQFWQRIPAGSFSLGSYDPTDLAHSTFWIVFLYGISENMRNYGTDQNYVQRMLCAADAHEARKSIWIGALSYLPISAIFCLIGTGLHVYYHAPAPHALLAADVEPSGLALIVTPQQLPLDTAADQVFPYFIKHELPPLARGLVIAGILAAAMSTVDSCLNSMSMIVLVDLVRRFRRRGPVIPEIITLRLFTAGLGGAATLLAATIYGSHGSDGSRTLLDIWWQYAGVAGAGLFGLFLLAWLMPAIPSWGALIAIVSSLPVLLWGIMARSSPPSTEWSWKNCPLHPNLVGISGLLTVLVVGGLFWLAVQTGLVTANPGHDNPRENA
ncbi:MAG: sodium/solute symporter [Planctomycetes bacterium]|nr:sodium/solute symporter [Planctomycetota bacterium]